MGFWVVFSFFIYPQFTSKYSALFKLYWSGALPLNFHFRCLWEQWSYGWRKQRAQNLLLEQSLQEGCSSSCQKEFRYSGTVPGNTTAKRSHDKVEETSLPKCHPLNKLLPYKSVCQTWNSIIMKEFKYYLPTSYKLNNKKLCAQILPKMLRTCIYWGWVEMK